MRFRILYIFLLSGMISHSVKSQSVNEQLWFEYMLDYPFANVWMFENAFTYSTILGSPKWRAFDYAPSIEYALTQNVDLITGATLSYTAQTEDYNTVEVRPMIGTRFHLTPNRRVLLRVQVRVEQRNFKNLETKEWEHVIRPRMRLESIIPLNKNTYFNDDLWYGIVDAEWLMAVDDDVNERFANRFRVRAGIGYRLSYTFRFEFIYMNQQSKNGIEDNFNTSDNVFRLRLKHYLRKTKPTQSTGVGN